jgi:hypothetical protein
MLDQHTEYVRAKVVRKKAAVRLFRYPHPPCIGNGHALHLLYATKEFPGEEMIVDSFRNINFFIGFVITGVILFTAVLRSIRPLIPIG